MLLIDLILGWYEQAKTARECLLSRSSALAGVICHTPTHKTRPRFLSERKIHLEYNKDS
jgi:hypothetical protein